jgi:hypothetical protein
VRLAIRGKVHLFDSAEVTRASIEL